MLLLKSWEGWDLVQVSVSLWTGVWIQGDFWQLLLPEGPLLVLIPTAKDRLWLSVTLVVQ